jgi:hypothetical protein
MKREHWQGSCRLLDGEKERGRVSYHLDVSIAETSEDGHEQARGRVRSLDTDAGAALFELFGRETPMTLAFDDGRRLDVVLVRYQILAGGLCEATARSHGAIYRPGESTK